MAAGAGTIIAVDGSAPGSGVIAGARSLHGSLGGPLQSLGDPIGRSAFLALLLVMIGGYAVAIAGARRIPVGLTAGVVVALHVLFVLAAPLLSTDVFSYVDYARLGVVHGLNPYAHSPAAAPQDPMLPLVGRVWRHTPTAYGPLFTAVSYVLAPLGSAAVLWAMKALAGVSSVVIAFLVARVARAAGRSGQRAGILLGLNPLMLVYGVGGAHNDLIMLAAGSAAVVLAARRRDAIGAAAVVAGAAVKASVALALPYLVAGASRRRPALAGAVLAIAAAAAFGFALFGPDVTGLASVLSRQQKLVSTDALPTIVAHLLGKPGVFPIDRTILRWLLAAILLGLLLAVWLRRLDWVAATGWALLAVVATTTWLLAWYTLWPLPFAVAAGDRRLIGATLGVQGLFVAHQLAPLLA